MLGEPVTHTKEYWLIKHKLLGNGTSSSCATINFVAYLPSQTPKSCREPGPALDCTWHLSGLQLPSLSWQASKAIFLQYSSPWRWHFTNPPPGGAWGVWQLMVFMGESRNPPNCSALDLSSLRCWNLGQQAGKKEVWWNESLYQENSTRNWLLPADNNWFVS
jgi:hypothetical protein